MSQRLLALIILDGFGLGPPTDSNAVFLAKTPTFDRLWERWPHTKLHASGREVGLPAGQMGNSEVGHLNLGGGRVVMQSLTYLTHLIETGEFAKSSALMATMDSVHQEGCLHVMGLASRGGVHSDLAHLFALLAMAEERNVPRIALHLFTDGRDVPPNSGLGYVAEVVDHLALHPRRGQIASIEGRYYAMDRDNRWDRVAAAYQAIVDGQANFSFQDPLEAVSAAYARGETDEFIKPTVITADDGRPVAPIKDGDAVVFFNFRADRGRELTYALMGEASWSGFARPRRVLDLKYCSMTEYDASWHLPYAFQVPEVDVPLAEVLSNHGLRQYHTAETEKYPHVTYFFNAKREEPYPGETRVLVPSPKVATYDLQPEMSAPELAKTTAERISTGVDDFILINFANPDMVGHTGVLEAAIKACEAADHGLGVVIEAVEKRGGVFLILADHGNAEVMRQPNGEPHTAHTTNLVPFIVGGDEEVKALHDGGKLADVAPTALELMGLPIPKEMTGKSLLG